MTCNARDRGYGVHSFPFFRDRMDFCSFKNSNALFSYSSKTGALRLRLARPASSAGSDNGAD